MRTISILMLMLMVFAFSSADAQGSKHRGQYPRLLRDGNVVDMDGRQLGSITREGQVADATGKLLGIIDATGEVLYANGKGSVGVFQEDGSLQTKKGYLIYTDRDGAVTVSGKLVAFVDQGYITPRHGAVLFCFFSVNNKDAKEVDVVLYQSSF